MNTPLIAPRVNLNGSPKQALLDQHIEVLETLRAAQKAMAAASPNGRDYQTFADPGTTSKAREAWGERQLMLFDLIREVEAVAIAISDQ